jgi:hypothetical protein
MSCIGAVSAQLCLSVAGLCAEDEGMLHVRTHISVVTCRASHCCTSGLVNSRMAT